MGATLQRTAEQLADTFKAELSLDDTPDLRTGLIFGVGAGSATIERLAPVSGDLALTIQDPEPSPGAAFERTLTLDEVDWTAGDVLEIRSGEAIYHYQVAAGDNLDAVTTGLRDLLTADTDTFESGDVTADAGVITFEDTTGWGTRGIVFTVYSADESSLDAGDKTLTLAAGDIRQGRLVELTLINGSVNETISHRITAGDTVGSVLSALADQVPGEVEASGDTALQSVLTLRPALDLDNKTIKLAITDGASISATGSGDTQEIVLTSASPSQGRAVKLSVEGHNIELAVGDELTLTLDGTDFTYTRDANTSAADVAEDLATLIGLDASVASTLNFSGLNDTSTLQFKRNDAVDESATADNAITLAPGDVQRNRLVLVSADNETDEAQAFARMVANDSAEAVLARLTTDLTDAGLTDVKADAVMQVAAGITQSFDAINIFEAIENISSGADAASEADPESPRSLTVLASDIEAGRVLELRANGETVNYTIQEDDDVSDVAAELAELIGSEASANEIQIGLVDVDDVVEVWTAGRLFRFVAESGDSADVAEAIAARINARDLGVTATASGSTITLPGQIEIAAGQEWGLRPLSWALYDGIETDADASTAADSVDNLTFTVDDADLEVGRVVQLRLGDLVRADHRVREGQDEADVAEILTRLLNSRLDASTQVTQSGAELTFAKELKLKDAESTSDPIGTGDISWDVFTAQRASDSRVGPLAEGEAVLDRTITIDDGDLDEGRIVQIRVAGERPVRYEVQENDDLSDVAEALAESLNVVANGQNGVDRVTADGGEITITEDARWGGREITVQVFERDTHAASEVDGSGESGVERTLRLAADDIEAGRLVEIQRAGADPLFAQVGSNQTAADVARNLARQISVAERGGPGQIKQNAFSVSLGSDSYAEITLPISISASPALTDALSERLPGFTNPQELGTLELNYQRLDLWLGARAGDPGIQAQLAVQEAAGPRDTSFGVGDTVADGTPVDTADESGLPGFNPVPFNDATGGEGFTTTPTEGAASTFNPASFAPTAQPGHTATGVSLILPNLGEWETTVQDVLFDVVGPIDQSRPTNGPLLFLLSDPSTIIENIDTVLSGIHRGIEIIASPLTNAPLIGNELSSFLTFVEDMREGFVNSLLNAIESVEFKYGAIDNGLRMALFDALHDPDNVFRNFIRDYNGDGEITPDDIVVEYVAPDTTERTVNLDPELTRLLEPEQLEAVLSLADSGQRTAWVASGERTQRQLVFTSGDDEGQFQLFQDSQRVYALVGEAYRPLVSSDMDFNVGTDDLVDNDDLSLEDDAELTENDIEDLIPVFEGIGGAVNFDLAFQELLENGVPVVADSFGEQSIDLDADPGDALFVVEFTEEQKQAALGIAMGQSSAVQFRMNLGQTYALPPLATAFDVGIPGFGLEVDGGIGLTLDWDLHLGFGFDIFDGFYLISDMPDRAGIGQLTVLNDDGVAIDIVDADIERTPNGEAILDDDGEEISLDDHIANLWEVDEDELASTLEFQAHAYLEGSSTDFHRVPVLNDKGEPTETTEIAFSDELFITDDDGNFIRDSLGNLQPLPIQAPAQLSAEMFFLTGTVTDNFDGWIKDNVGRVWGDREAFKRDNAGGPFEPDSRFRSFGGEELFDGKTGFEGSRTQFLANFSIDLDNAAEADSLEEALGFEADGLLDELADIDDGSDGRITLSVLQSNELADLWDWDWEAYAQVNLKARLGVDAAGEGFLPAINGDFHLTWSDSRDDDEEMEEWELWLERFEDLTDTDYYTLFADQPGVWMTDISMDLGTLFSNFIRPVLNEIQKVTGPFQPLIDLINTPIPGISDVMRRDYSLISMAEDFQRISGGTASVGFVLSVIDLIDTINSISRMNSSLQIPVYETLKFAGQDHDLFDLSAVADFLAPVADFLSPDLPGETTISFDDGMDAFFAEFEEPENALAFPIIEDPFSTVVNLLTGKPADLMTFTPPNLEIDVRFRKSFPVFGPLFVGIEARLMAEAALQIGFDTFGINKAIQSGNPADVFDGFYVSDNVINGVDEPEFELRTELNVFAELNAGIARGGVEGGIGFTGTANLCDPNQDGRVRASEIASILASDPLGLVTINMSADAYIRAYVEILALFTYVRVFEQTFMRVELFNVDVGSCGQDPILASEDGSVLVLHAGSGIGSIDGQPAITQTAADRERRSTEDGDETFVLTGDSGNIKIEATLPNGQTYEQSYGGTRVHGFTGRGTDVFDASGLSDVPVYFVAGEGNNTLIAGNAAGNVLIGGSSGTTTLVGGTADDLLIARGGTTIMQGGDGDDTYRFLQGWGNATIEDTQGRNIVDFSAQSNSVTVDDAARRATQGANTVVWNASAIDLIKGGSGSDTIDFSGNNQNLTITLTDTNEGWVTNSRTGTSQSGLPIGPGSGQSNSGQGYRFEAFENLQGGRGSDVVRVQDGASVSGSIVAGTSNNLPNARNTLDFSEFTDGVRVDLLGDSAFGDSQNVRVRGFHNVFGGEGNDVLIGNGLNNLLVGNGGADRLSAIGGHNLLVADEFRTQLTGTSTWYDVNDYVSLETAGQEANHGSDGRRWLWKGKTLESLNINGGRQTLRGAGGNDILMGALGSDTITTGEGNNTVMADLGTIVMDFTFNVPLRAETNGGDGGGNDVIEVGGGNNIILGGDGNDTIRINDGREAFNIVLGNNGEVAFKQQDGTFALNDLGQRMLDYVIAPDDENGGSGGNNRISMNSGSAIVMGGRGAHTITAAVLSSDARNTRYIAGDNAWLRTDANGGIHEFSSLVNESSVPNGDDVIVIGDANDSNDRHLGTNYILGGVGDDTIITSGTIRGDEDSGFTLSRGQAVSTDVILGDLGYIRWYDSSVTNASDEEGVPNRLREVTSGFYFDATDPIPDLDLTTSVDVRGIGGANTIHVGDGDKIIHGGFGGEPLALEDRLLGGNFGDEPDSISNVITAAAFVNNASGDFNRVIAGNNAQVKFDRFGNWTEFRSLDTARETGGNTFIQIGNGADGTGRDLGFNFVIGGMGADIILVSGSLNTQGRLVQGEATSEDVLMGDNGEILRSESTGRAGTTDALPNRMLSVTSLELTLGRGDRIHTGNGGKVIIGGIGGDVISALDGVNIIFGDNARLEYDRIAETGVLLKAESLQRVLGGNDDIRVREGYKVISGGRGDDVITVDATGTPEATGMGFETIDGFKHLAGVTGIAAVTSTSQPEKRGRTGRFIAGDNVVFEFDRLGGLTRMATTDTISATGGSDTITIGRNTTENLGFNVVMGGMGSDNITVAQGSYSQSILLGDNGQFLRQTNSYELRQIASTVTNAGGNNTIRSGSGDQIVIGGFGRDRIDLATSAERATAETDGYNRSIVLGDAGVIDFNRDQLRLIESIDLRNGDDDIVTIGDGDVTFVGGRGSDRLTVNSREEAFRIAVGDNARLEFAQTAEFSDQAGELTRLITTDLRSSTGGNDVINIGLSAPVTDSDGNTVDLGEVVAVGGMGSDIIRVGGGRAVTTLVGDNVRFDRVPNSVTDRDGRRVRLTSLNPELGGNDTLRAPGGDYVLVGGAGSDQLTAGKGLGVVLGDSGRLDYDSNGVLRSATSLGLSEGGNDTITLGSTGDLSITDDAKRIIGGTGNDVITITADAGTEANRIERSIAGDNASLSFDDQGRLTRLSSLDSSPDTGGDNRITVNVGGAGVAGVHTDYHAIAGGTGNAIINVNAAARVHNVISGDNLEYRQGIDENDHRQPIFAGVTSRSFGGDNNVRVGQGDAILLGGLGNDVLRYSSASGDRSVVIGDVGNVIFDSAGSGQLRQIIDTQPSQGGDDTIALGAGDVYVIGGAGADTISARADDDALRVLAGDAAQITFDGSGEADRLQALGPQVLSDPSQAADRFILPSDGEQFVMGGPGVDSLTGGTNATLLPGYGSINLKTGSVSVVVLGESGDLGVVDNDALVMPEPAEGEESVPEAIPVVTEGRATLVSGAATQASGRIAYPQSGGGFSTFSPSRNSQQGDFGYLEMGEDGSWRYYLGQTGPDADDFDEDLNAAVQALRTGQTVSDRFSVTTTAGTGTTVAIHIEGRTSSFQDATGSIDEKAEDPLTGTLTDPGGDDRSRVVTVSGEEGDFGTLNVNADGEWDYTLDNDNPAVARLASDETLTDTFSIDTPDGESVSLTLTINGVNDDPVIETIDALTINQGETKTRTVTISDPDQSDDQHEVRIINVVIDGADEITGVEGALTLTPVLSGDATSGTLTLDFDASSDLFGFLAEGESVTLIYTLEIDDQNGGTDTEDFEVTVNGVNTPPVIELIGSDSASLALIADGSSLSGTGTLTVSDANVSDEVTAADVTLATVGGSFDGMAPITGATLAGMLSVTSTDPLIPDDETQAILSWAFDDDGEDFTFLAQDETLVLEYTVGVNDGTATTGQTITVTLTGTNINPSLSDDEATVDTRLGQRSANGTLTAEDPDLSDTANITLAGVAVDAGSTFVGTNPLSTTDLEAMFALPSNPVIASGQATGTVNWDWQAEPDDFAFLAEGETLVLDYTVELTDQRAATTNEAVRITVVGSNAPPVLTASSATELSLTAGGGGLAGSGSLTVADPNLNDVLTSRVAGVTVSGATAAAGVGNAALLDMVSVSQSGDQITWQFDSGAQTFAALNAGTSLVLDYTIEVVDGQGGQDQQTIRIDIAGVNTPAVIGGDLDLTVVESTAPVATGTLTIVDPDAGEAAFQALNTVGQFGEFSLAPGGQVSFVLDESLAAIRALDRGETLSEQFTVTSLDGTFASLNVQVIGTSGLRAANEQATIETAVGREPQAQPTASETARTPETERLEGSEAEDTTVNEGVRALMPELRMTDPLRVDGDPDVRSRPDLGESEGIGALAPSAPLPEEDDTEAEAEELQEEMEELEELDLEEAAAAAAAAAAAGAVALRTDNARRQRIRWGWGTEEKTLA